MLNFHTNKFFYCCPEDLMSWLLKCLSIYEIYLLQPKVQNQKNLNKSSAEKLLFIIIIDL